MKFLKEDRNFINNYSSKPATINNFLDTGTYGFVSKQAFKEFKKLSKLLVKEQNHYDEVLDSLESNANTDESWDSLMADEYYQQLIKVSQDTYEIIHDLSKAFDDGTIYIEDDPYDDRILINSTLYSVEDINKLLNYMRDSIK